MPDAASDPSAQPAEAPLAGLRGGPPVLVTGAAGFVGFHLAERLLDAGVAVTGLDNLNPYYDPALKQARLDRLRARPGFRFERTELADRDALRRAFDAHRPRHVVHLAAQAGVRYSISDPHVYGESNLTGFLNILEECRRVGVAHLLYASSSSVYGGNRKLPYAVGDAVDHPVSLYAATKRANELMAHAYAHLYALPATGLRFFTVYGPWGRPDMAYWRFAEAILEGRPIDVYNHGDMGRDFTWIGDIVEAVTRLIALPAAPDPAFDPMAPDPGASWAPHRIYNLGATRPEPLMAMIAILEAAIGRTAEKRFLPMQPGDVLETCADAGPLAAATGWRPTTPLAEGLPRFVDWFRAWRGAA
jgi:UDP-glucuronate 4-epimerase